MDITSNNRGMAGDKVIMGLIGLFFITVIYYFGDPILRSSRLHTVAAEVKPELTEQFLNGWTNILPAFVAACLLLILMGGRKEDYPSEVYR